MTTYTILPGLSLCVFKLQKDICAKEIIDEIGKCITDSRWRSNYDVLLEMSLLDTMFHYEEFNPVRDFILSMPIFKNVKQAMVLSTTTIKVDSQKWAQEIKPHNMTYQTFSSLENALQWLGISVEDYQLHIFHSKL